MADTEQQVVMLGDDSPAQTQCITENGEIITVTQGGEVVSGGVGEDILQQALDEATESYENADVEYTTDGEGIAVVADSNGTLSDANGVTYSYVTTNISNVSDSQDVVTASHVEPGQSLIRVAAPAPDTAVTVNPQTEVVTIPATTGNVLAAINNGTTTAHIPQNQGVQVQQQIVQPQMVRIIQPGQVLGQDMGVQQIVQQQGQSSPMPQTLPQQTHVQLSQSASGTPGAITVLTNSGTGSGPLGSSGNPIRIIQQGNKYTSVQQLTAEQVAQIMQVVQQQQLAQSTTGGGSSVLFNSQTQTRIVYRVIYPSELHSKVTGPGGATVSPGSGPKTITVPRHMVTLGGPKRVYKKRNREDEEKIDGPDLSREEKETKKKHRPRTRSGRVSRPPKHMVQDYKHIHHLDWEEDYDDSDGGYSDYHVSENEEGGHDEKNKEAIYVSSGLGSSKPKNHNCKKCDKAYIGAAGLARHYRLNPDHGNPQDVLPLIPLTPNATNGMDMVLNSGDESSTQDSISSTASVPCSSQQTSPIATSTPSVATPVTLPPMKHTPRGVHRTKHVYQDNTPARRKARLKDLVRQCKNEELMEVVLPRLARAITLWEFMVMKVEKGRPSRPHITDILNEYEMLNKEVSNMCSDYLVPIEESSLRSPLDKHRTNVLQMTNQVIAEALGLDTGKYLIRDTPKGTAPPQTYKIISSTPDTDLAKSDALLGPGTKRKVQVVTPEEFMQLTKRQCLVTDPSTSQTISDKLPSVNPPSTASTSTISSTPLSHLTIKEALARGQVLFGQNHVNREPSGGGNDDVVMTQIINTDDGNNQQIDARTVGGGQETEGMTIVLKDEEGEGGGRKVLVGTGNTVLHGTGNTVLHGTGNTVLHGTENTVLHTVRVDQGEVMEGAQVNGSNNEVVMNSTGSEYTHHTVMDSDGLNQNVTTEVIMSDSQAAVVGAGEGQQAVVIEQVMAEEEEEQSQIQKVEVEEEGGEGLLQTAEVNDKKGPEIMLVSDGQVSEQSTTNSTSQALPIETHVLQDGTEVDHQQQQSVDQQQQQQHIVTQDGQTVLFTNDGGQTYYQQNLHMEGSEVTEQEGEVVEQQQQQQHPQQQQQQHEIPLDTSNQQLVSMETPDGLVEGQLVTNEDGTQFLIHQQPAEQQLFQTPEGLILIQNPDGTLRIHNQGDQQIPLETVQALLAVDGEGQVQVESGSIEQGT